MQQRMIEVKHQSKLPKQQETVTLFEPFARVEIHVPNEYVGNVFKLCEEKRGIQKKFEYLGGSRILLVYELPLNEIVLDFYDRLKSASRGYASLDYHLSGTRISPMSKLDVLVAGEAVDADAFSGVLPG